MGAVRRCRTALGACCSERPVRRQPGLPERRMGQVDRAIEQRNANPRIATGFGPDRVEFKRRGRAACNDCAGHGQRADEALDHGYY